MALAICSCLEKCGASGDKPRNFLLTQCYVSDSYYYSAADMVVEYCDESVCGCVCLSVRDNIFGTTHQVVAKCFVHVTYGHSSVLLWQHTDTLCTSGFVDDVIFSWAKVA